jgi:hypothetical protein
MAKIIEGVALVAGALALTVFTFGAATPLLTGTIGAIVGGGLLSIGSSLLLGGIAKELEASPSLAGSIRQPAAPRQIIYGQNRVAGTIVYISTTDSGHDLNIVIAWAGHKVSSFDAVYLDGRKVIFDGGNIQADSSDHYDDNGNKYNFGGKVVVWHSWGDVPSGYFTDLTSRDSKWTSDCRLDGIASSYIRCRFDQNVFQGVPAIKATLKGKVVYDPRTGTYVYSENAALIIADVLMSNEWGLGCTLDEIDIPQLIAAANLCDEQVALANGGTESRYTINGTFTTDSTPGEILDAMLASCEGRLSYIGGKWRIMPGAWYGSGLSFGPSDIVGPIKWTPKRKYRDLVNTVRATYISPKYPYASIGFDRDHKDDSVWSGQWQPADAPEYAQDAAHGYDTDANLASDGNVKLYATRSYRFTQSVATAQRLSKIYLMRNRQQGSGTLRMSLAAYQCVAGDIIQVTFPALNWTDKYLEVQSMRFVAGTDNSGASGGDQEAVNLQVELDVVETDPSVYLWSTAEERGMLNTASPTIPNTWQVNPPTSLVCESGSDTAVIGADGIVQPRIKVTWIEPDDPFVLSGGCVEVQWAYAGVNNWMSSGYLDPTTTNYFIGGVVVGWGYGIRIRAGRSSGATSDWVYSDTHTVSTTLSSISFENISGLGTLATRNFVDFATGDVANKTANNLHYSTGLSVEQLRPAEFGAETTTGKSIDILADGTIYGRVKADQLHGGAIVGKSYGHNIIPNSGFEVSHGNSFDADDWDTTGDSTNVYGHGRVTSGARSGNCAYTIQMTANAVVPVAGSSSRTFSTPIPIPGGANIFFGGYMSALRTFDITPWVSIISRIGLWITDVNHNLVAEYTLDVNNNSSFGWTLYTDQKTLPSNAAWLQFELAAFAINNAGTPIAANGQTCHSTFFDDVFAAIQLDNSALFNPQGSILPNQPITINYSVTKNSMNFTWPATTMLRADGSSLNVQAGSASYSGLSSSTTYYTYWYVRVSDGAILGTHGSPPPTSPSALMAMQTGLDGRIAVAMISVTTLAADNNGSGGGTGGGADTCPEAGQLVDIEGKGHVTVGTVQVGDKIRGKCFATGEDVYRRVEQIHDNSCASWRIVEGYRVTPCEPVHYNDQWVAAYRASTVVDRMVGRRVYLSVEADEYDEHNYYLVGGETDLLIHNSPPVLVCN